MILNPRPHDRAALAFDDLASALDAGLSPTALGAEAGADGPALLRSLLRDRKVAPLPGELDVLEAAWDSGRIGAALRRRASLRRHRADLRRAILAGLSYPALLLAVAVPVSLLVGVMSGDYRVLVGLLAILGTLLVLGFWVRASARRGGAALRLPRLGPLLTDLAELPYLEVLNGLYASGVPLLSAHPRAVTVCPLPPVQTRLAAADALLQQGRPLAEALANSQAVNAETRSLVASGEGTGNLEDALSRALIRRTEVVTLQAGQLIKVLAGLAYALAVVVVLVLVLRFYSSYFARLRLR